MPIFALTTRRIVTLVDISCHRGVRHLVRAWPLYVGVAKIGKLLNVADSAMGAGQAHRVEPRANSVKVRLGADALLVDQIAGGEAIEAIGGGEGV
jgi:hypothetical protein